MCYSVSSGTRAKLKYARHRAEDPDYIRDLEQQLELLLDPLPAWHVVSGFLHPLLWGFSNQAPFQPRLFHWGLIPSWIQDEEASRQIRTQTLNARSETLFEKASFKQAIQHRRCILYVDAFYEYHHQGRKSFPFRIEMKDESPMILAGIWEEWLNKNTGELICSTSIITCPGNALLAHIHNNPKLEGPRMPVILNQETQNSWLSPDLNSQDIKSILQPCPEQMLKAFTVRPLSGKFSIGNVPEATLPFTYPEISFGG